MYHQQTIFTLGILEEDKIKLFPVKETKLPHYYHFKFILTDIHKLFLKLLLAEKNLDSLPPVFCDTSRYQVAALKNSLTSKFRYFKLGY